MTAFQELAFFRPSNRKRKIFHDFHVSAPPMGQDVRACEKLEGWGGSSCDFFLLLESPCWSLP